MKIDNIMNHLALITGSLLLLTLADPCAAKEWRNIVPLKTKRADVLRVLGEPKHSQPDGREYFEVDNQTATIRWKRPDCFGRDSMIDEQSVGPDALVYQITVTPKVPLKSISEVSGEPDKASDLKVPRKRDKAALKELYRSWLSQDIDCIGNDESGYSCTIWDGQKGFGYTESKGVTALYYFPTDKEARAWEQNHKPCSQYREQRVTLSSGNITPAWTEARGPVLK